MREAAARIILRDQDDGPIASIMITSCVSSEPRHLVSIETALLLARFHRRVLLIDCDTDHSQLSHALGASKSVGIRQLPIAQDRPTVEAISQLLIATDDKQIDFLPAGPESGEESWIDPRSLRSTIEVMQEVYDVIIVNGPSIMGSAESILLAAEVDASVFAVFINQSRFDHLILCEEVASDAGVNVGGSILQRGKRKCSIALRTNQTVAAQKSISRASVSRASVSRASVLEASVLEASVSAASVSKSESFTHRETETDESSLKREIEELQNELLEIQSGGTEKRGTSPMP